MFTLFTVLAAIVAVLLILVVLVQNPKGGGIASNFSAANQIAGVKKTNEFVEKATWTLALALVLLSIGSRFVYSPDTTTIEGKDDSFIERLQDAPTNPALPGPAGDAETE